MAKRKEETNEVVVEKETVKTNETIETQNDEVKVKNETMTNNDVKVVKETTEKTIVFQATRPMTYEEHMELSKRLRYEQEQSGVKVVLLPYSGKVGE